MVLEKGLVITKIYQIIHYNRNACFTKFTEEVSDARREGDLDPSSSVKSESMKLLGNCSYGACITDVTKFEDVFFIKDKKT